MNTCCVAGWGSASSAGFSKLCPRVIPTCVQSPAFLWTLPDSSSMLFSPPLPILSSRSSPLFSSRSFLSPSSILSFFLPLLVSTLRLPSHAFFFYFTSPPPPPRPHPMLLPSYAACTHASPWPPCLHPLLNYSWESSPVSGGLCREERRRVQRQ